MTNNIFKTLRRAFFIAALAPAVALTSCDSDTLDLTPSYSFSEDTAFDTAEHCALSVVGAYDACQCSAYNGSYSRGYPFGAASIMQGEMRGEDFMMSQQFYLVTYRATYNTSSANNVYMWEASFEALNKVNTVLEGVTEAGANGILSQDVMEQYQGEMKFLRALIYQNLLTHFSAPYNMSDYNNDYGLPIYTTAHTTTADIDEALTIGRSTVEETYDQILEDLNSAESLLPETNDDNNITRANKYAAIALKTRVYLHMRQWSNVITEATKLENAGVYELESDPATPFLSYSSNGESIFSIENNAEDNGSVNGSMASMFNPYNRYMCPMSPILYNTSYWLEDDKRRTELVVIYETDQVPYCYKYQSTDRSEYAPMLRMAEVYMNHAEAALRSGDTATALTYLNMVRNRSLADPDTQAYTADSFSSTEDFFDAIYWERQIEFFGEGLRWGDIHRLCKDDLHPMGGIPAKIAYASVSGDNAADVFVIGKEIDPAWYLIDAIDYTDRRFLWPIPTSELTSNATLAAQQNVGW